jgi:hypothetical protein
VSRLGEYGFGRDDLSRPGVEELEELVVSSLAAVEQRDQRPRIE